MKVTISTFTDYQNANYTDQKNLIEKLKLQSLFIRTIEGKSILSMDLQTLNGLAEYVKNKEVLAVDPLIEAAKINDEKKLAENEVLLEEAASKAKQLRSKNLIYRIPKFTDVIKEKDKILTIIKKEITIIKKFKLEVLIMPDNEHPTKTYRFIMESLKDSRVKLVFNPVYAYKLKESEIASYRLVREYVGLFIAEDCDKLLSPRLLTKGNAFDLKGLFKRLIENNYEGLMVLDSNILDLLNRAKTYTWLDKTFNKEKKNEYSIYEEYIALNKGVNIFDSLKSQLLILYLVFLNKKTL